MKINPSAIKVHNFSYHYYKKCSLIVINDYKKHKSLYLVALNNNFDYEIVFNRFIQGQLGNSQFKAFYLAVKSLTDEVRDDNNINQVSGLIGSI